MDPNLLKEMPVQEAFGVKCPLTLPWFYQIKGVPVGGGQTVEFYGTIVTGAITLTATILSLMLAWIHMVHYSRPHQQKHIIRILWMVPVFTLISSVATLNYPSFMYLETLQQMYEAIALSSIFNLFANYVRDGFDAQLAFFGSGEYHEAMSDTGTKRTGYAAKMKVGSRWYKIIFFVVFQYPPLMFLTMIFTWITVAAGVYCASSTAPQFAHIYLFVIPILGLTACMFGIVAFYKCLKPLIKQHRPIFQLACIKIVVILNSVQGEIIEILLSKGTIKETPAWTYGDITVMVPGFLIALECLGISVLFYWAFDPRPYFLVGARSRKEDGIHSSDEAYYGGVLGLKALFDAAWMFDLLKDCYLAFALLPSIFRGDKEPASTNNKAAQYAIPTNRGRYEAYKAAGDSLSDQLLGSVSDTSKTDS